MFKDINLLKGFKVKSNNEYKQDFREDKGNLLNNTNKNNC